MCRIRTSKLGLTALWKCDCGYSWLGLRRRNDSISQLLWLNRECISQSTEMLRAPLRGHRNLYWTISILRTSGPPHPHRMGFQDKWSPVHLFWASGGHPGSSFHSTAWKMPRNSFAAGSEHHRAQKREHSVQRWRGGEGRAVQRGIVEAWSLLRNKWGRQSVCCWNSSKQLQIPV